MAEKEIVVQLRLEDRNAVARLGQLETETKKYQRDLRQLNAEILKNGTATRAQLEAVGELNARIRRNQSVIRELKNDLSGATAAGLRFRDKMAEASRAGLGAFGLSTLGVTAAVTGLVSILRASISAFQEQEKAEKQLRFAAGDASEALIAQAKALQQVSTVGDEVIIGQQAFLASLGFTEKQIKAMIPAALDLAAATGKDLEFAVRNLAKTYSGLTGELGELIPGIKQFTKEELEAGAATRYASEQFAGQAQLMTTTSEGAIAQMHNALSDLSEVMGGPLAKAIATVANGLTDLFGDGIADKIANNQAKVTDLVLSKLRERIKAEGELRKINNTTNQEQIDAFRIKLQGYLDEANSINTLEFLDARRNDAIARRTELENMARDAADKKGEALTITQEIELAQTKVLIDQLGRRISTMAKVDQQDEKNLVTLGALKERLTELKKEKDAIEVTDTAALATKQKEIDALEKQIKALDGAKDGVVRLTDAEKERLKVLEALRLAQIDIANLLSESATSNPFEVDTEGGLKTIVPRDEDIEFDKVAERLVQKRKDLEEELRLLGLAGVENKKKEMELLKLQYETGIINAEEYAARVQGIQNGANDAMLNSVMALSAAIGETLGNAFKDVEDANKRILITILETVKSAIRLYLAGTLAKELFTKGFAGVATFAVISTLVEAALAAAQANIQGFEEGGYTPRKGSDSAPVGVVHANEYVVPAPIVRNPRFRPILDELEDARRRMGMGFGNGAYAVGGLVRGTALVNLETVPAGVIAQADLQRALNGVNFSPVVRVTDINSVQGAVRVQDQRSTL